MDTAHDDQVLIVTLRCREVATELRRLGHATSNARGLTAILNPTSELHARIILINRTALTSVPLRVTLEALRVAWPLVDVVIWGAGAPSSFVREALQAGAKDVLLTKSARAAAEAVGRIAAEQQLLPRAMRLGTEEERESNFEGMVSRNAAMWDLFDTASKVAPTDAAVLVLGETGTGKELLARAIHKRSARQGRFVAVNCAAVAEELIDSELFGHISGSFTGATQDKEGLMRYADGGTLMLDEIGNIKLAGQHRLLRALQEETIRPVGGHKEIPIDVRIIAATSVRLEEEVLAGRFREDLFYRLDVIRLEVPPLRDRPEDIIFLFGHFARQFATQYNLERPTATPGFLDALVRYAWPGNVRQLENVTERLLLTSDDRKLPAEALQGVLPFKNDRKAATIAASPPAPTRLDFGKPLRAALAPHIDRLEREYFSACLARTEGQIGKAAQHAGINRRTLRRKLEHHALDKRDFKGSTDKASKDR